MELLIIITLIIIALFLASYLMEPRRLINGLLFMFTAGITAFTALVWAYQTENRPILLILSVLFLILGVILVLSSFILIIACFINFFILIKREGFRKAYLLVLGLGIFTILTMVLSAIEQRGIFSGEANLLITYANVLVGYGFFVSVNFLVSCLLYSLYRPRHNKDYIIVLGAGLIDGVRVSRLLGNRIDKAIAFYHKQKDKGRKPPKLILSGGKGADEILSEAFAMQTYAIEKGIPIEDTILEEGSTNTYENMLYSRDIILNRCDGKKYRALYSTNNFHLMRAGILARRVGLKAQGISAKTAAYYYPNALIREFIGTLYLHKKRHFVAVVLLFLLSGGLFVLNKYFS